MAKNPNTHGGKSRDRYSTVVRVLQWVFPILALILIASVFVLSNSRKILDGKITLPPGIESLATGQRITNPHFSGVTNSGDAFTISADSALPDGPSPKKIQLDNPSTAIDFKDGRQMYAQAGSGTLDLNDSQATLDGNVSIRTTSQVEAQTTGVVINFETGNANSLGPVSAEGPMGSITAGGFVLTQNLDRNPPGRAVLVFNNGVKLIYTSANQ